MGTEQIFNELPIDPDNPVYSQTYGDVQPLSWVEKIKEGIYNLWDSTGGVIIDAVGATGETASSIVESFKKPLGLSWKTFLILSAIVLFFILVLYRVSIDKLKGVL